MESILKSSLSSAESTLAVGGTSTAALVASPASAARPSYKYGRPKNWRKDCLPHLFVTFSSDLEFEMRLKLLRISTAQQIQRACKVSNFDILSTENWPYQRMTLYPDTFTIRISILYVEKLILHPGWPYICWPFKRDLLRVWHWNNARVGRLRSWRTWRPSRRSSTLPRARAGSPHRLWYYPHPGTAATSEAEWLRAQSNLR